MTGLNKHKPKDNQVLINLERPNIQFFYDKTKYNINQLDISLKSPLVFTTNFLLFLRSEVILNVEGPADLLGCLSLDHVCYSLACKIKQVLDV